MNELYKQNLRYDMFDGYVRPLYLQQLRYNLFGGAGVEAISERERNARIAEQSAYVAKLSTIERKPGYLFNDTCENPENERDTLRKWKERFGGIPWTMLYKELPIFIIEGHGSVQTSINPTVSGVVSYEIPRLVQYISDTRSGAVAIVSKRYDKGEEIYYNDDVRNSAFNPNEERLYLLEDDGIKRKSPFFYYPHGAPYYSEDYEQDLFETACQKLYRQGDTINNLTINFYDFNGAFESKPSINNVTGTGISVFNSIKSPDQILKEIRDMRVLVQNAEEANQRAQEENQRKFIELLEGENLDQANRELLIDITDRIFKERKQIHSMKELINMLLEDIHITSFDQVNDRYNFKITINNCGNPERNCRTDLYTIMNLFGTGTYYAISCKMVNKYGLQSSQFEETQSLTREVSAKRELPQQLFLDGTQELRNPRWVHLQIDAPAFDSGRLPRITSSGSSSGEYSEPPSASPPHGVAGPQKLYIQTLDGKTLIIDIVETDTILNIKSKIRDTVGYPVEHQKLIFEGKNMDNNRTLADYNYRGDETLHLIVRSPDEDDDETLML